MVIDYPENAYRIDIYVCPGVVCNRRAGGASEYSHLVTSNYQPFGKTGGIYFYTSYIIWRIAIRYQEGIYSVPILSGLECRKWVISLPVHACSQFSHMLRAFLWRTVRRNIYLPV